MSYLLDVRCYRYRIMLPVIAAVTTFGLWSSGRSQYLRLVCPPSESCPDGWSLGWTDYTPAAIQAAGMLNIPIAFFAHPLYRLVQGHVRNLELMTLLLGAVATWGYIGWRLDRRNSASRAGATSRVIAVLGCIFALLTLLQTITVFHVGVLYKIVAVGWSLLMFRHFARILEARLIYRENKNDNNRRLLPQHLFEILAITWALFLVLAGVLMSPRYELAVPDPALAHVFAACGGVLLLVTGSAMVVQFVTEWRNSSMGRRPAVLDLCLFLTGLLSVSFAILHG